MSVDLKSQISVISDWPRAGITTYDIAPLLANQESFHELIEQLAVPYLNQTIDVVVGIEARGFVLAAGLAERLGAGIILIRKKDKLPPPTVSQEYSFEYAAQVMEVSANAFRAGANIVLADDILATGGTMAAAVKLIKNFVVEIVGISFVIEMDFMAGRDRLKGQVIHSLIKY